MKMRVLAVTGALLAALSVAGCGSSSSSSSTGSSTPATTTSTATTPSTASTPTTATIDAKALFVNGDPATGAAACGSCHMLKAAGTTGKIGPDLDKIATADKAEQLKEMILDPDGEIVDGFQKGIMPATYGKTLTPEQVDALAAYIDENSAHAE